MFCCCVTSVLFAAQNATLADLSGTWQLDIQKSKVTKNSNTKSETLVIVASDSSIQMTYTTDGKQLPVESYVPDGKEKAISHRTSGAASSDIVTKATWKGQTLVTEIIGRVGGTPLGASDILHDKTTWKLSADGNSLTRELDSPKQMLEYDRQ